MSHRDTLRTLAEDFVRGALPGALFEQTFLEERRRTRDLPFGKRARLHDELFMLIENYCSDPALQGHGEFDDDALRGAVAEALDQSAR